MNEESVDLTEKVSPNTVLVLKNVKKYFPVKRGILDVLLRKPVLYVKAVDGVSFCVETGEVFCLVGESGCGKTTTGRLITRLIKLTSGRILYKPKEETLEIAKAQGLNIDDRGFLDISFVKGPTDKALRRDIQMIFQDPYGSLDPRQTVYSALEEPLLIHKIGSSRNERYELVIKALEEVKLVPPEEFLGRFPHMLSGGQRQRVNIARALILRPKLIVADEPVSMLDVSIRAEILQLMLDLKESRRLTYIFITHDLAVASYICNKIAVMYLGKIVELGETRKVIDNPYHPYTKALIAAVPEPDPSNRFRIREVPIIGEVPSAVAIPSGCRFHTRCLYAMDICKRKEPPFIEVEPDHYVACWLHMKK